MGARLYNSATGRFLQVDPVLGGSANAYDYCRQDPVNCNDLNGQEADTEAGMTDAEIAWCALPSRWRLCTDAVMTSKIAREWTVQAFGDRNGRSYADAFLHIVWMAWLSYLDGESTALLRISEIPHCRSPKFPRQPEAVKGLGGA